MYYKPFFDVRSAFLNAACDRPDVIWRNVRCLADDLRLESAQLHNSYTIGELSWQSMANKKLLQLIQESPGRKAARRFLFHPSLDFWLLGGASLAVWAAMLIGVGLRPQSLAIQQRFLQLGGAFAFLSLVCNHPHFIISYRFGYGRGIKFILRHWFSLIFVPVGLFATFACAYFFFESDPCNVLNCNVTNDVLAQLGLGFRVGSAALGAELMSDVIRIMYLTVGWHYAKQVYGCMMVYSHYDGYHLGRRQKAVIRWALISISIFQFLDQTARQEALSPTGGADFRFPGISLGPLGLPAWLERASLLLMLILNAAILVILARNYRRNKAKPSLNFLISWLAFIVWWASPVVIPEFFLVIPFFHSLQYLPFAFAAETRRAGQEKNYLTGAVLMLSVLATGFVCFEFAPGFIDQKLDTDIYKLPWFFTTSAALFINIHHFFIDSVVWKFQQPEMRAAILNPEEAVVKRRSSLSSKKSPRSRSPFEGLSRPL